MQTVSQRKIAVLSLSGLLSKAGDWGTSYIAARQELRFLAANPTVRAILVSIDSPGGLFHGANELSEDIFAARSKKPVHAHITDLAAGSAYWAAAAASRVSVNVPGSVGSLGQAAVLVDSSEAAAKAGVKVHVVRAGEFKGLGTPGAPVSPEHLAHLQGLVSDRHEMMLSSIARYRGLTVDHLRTIADGKLLTAREALRHRLVDDICSFDFALQKLKENIV